MRPFFARIDQYLLPLAVTLGGLCFAYIILGNSGLLITDLGDPRSYLSGGDFSFFWAAPQIAREDIAILLSAPDYMQRVTELYPGGKINYNALPYAYPLHSLFFYAPLSYLPYLSALAIWTFLGLACYACAVWYTMPTTHRRWAIFCLLLAPATFVCVMVRQNGLLIGAAALASLLLMERGRPILAGIVLGCLTIKPHLFLLWPIMLIMRREWTVILSAGITTVLLLAASLAIHGVDTWARYIDIIPAIHWEYVTTQTKTLRIFQMMMPGPVMTLGLMGIPLAIITWIYGAIVLLVVLGTVLAFRGKTSLADTVIILALGGMLTTPYAYNYDFPLMSAGIFLAWLTQRSPSPWVTVPQLLTYMLPVTVYLLNMHRTPGAFLLMVITFFIAVHHACRGEELGKLRDKEKRR